MQHPDGGYVFIVTYGRSGSTVLQSLLQSISGYCIRGENMNALYPLYLASRAVHDTRYKHGRKEHKPNYPWYGADKVVPERFTEKLVNVFVKEVLQPSVGARVVGFKEIRFHEAGEEYFEGFMNFIYENFPKSKFVFNTRPWEEVATSGWWATMRPERVQKTIMAADSLYERYIADYADRCIHMRHEITRETPEAFKPLFDFLGEDYNLEKIQEIVGKRLGHSGV